MTCPGLSRLVESHEHLQRLGPGADHQCLGCRHASRRRPHAEVRDSERRSAALRRLHLAGLIHLPTGFKGEVEEAIKNTVKQKTSLLSGSSPLPLPSSK